MAVKIGFVGSGGIAAAHMNALEQLEEAEPVAFMDIDHERAAQAAARFPGAGAYSDLEQMLEAQELDTAYICVPPGAHGEIELALIERGIPFFVEKPIARDRETPARILEALQEAELLSCVGYMCRYHSTVQQAREHLSGEEPVLARGAWIGGMPGGFWWRQKSLSGGQIMEQTTHVFDMARYLLGEVTGVFCVGRTGLIKDVENYDIEDASICTLTFESGLVCEISSTCAVHCGGGVTMEVFCRNSRVKLDGWNLELQKPGERCERQASDDAFLMENKAWLDALQSGDGSGIKSPYEDAYRTQMVTCAANESMESGRPETP